MASEAEQRAAVVAEAMSWLKTPYHPRAAVKGAGVDCAQFPLAVYAAAGIIPVTDVGAYSPQWHLHRDEEIYLGWIEKFAHRIAEADVGPGDFAIWRFGRTFSHGGILLDERRIIHSWIGLGVVIDRRDQHEELLRRPCLIFSVWGQ